MTEILLGSNFSAKTNAPQSYLLRRFYHQRVIFEPVPMHQIYLDLILSSNGKNGNVKKSFGKLEVSFKT